MASNKTVLITGATGFIGRSTVSSLVAAGWKVTQGVRSYDNKLTDGFVHLDLAEPSTILDLAKDHHFEAIIHLGAHIGWSGATESEMFVPNVLSTGCLAYLSQCWDAHLIYASAAIVHGVKNENITLESPICLDSVYAKSKWHGEQLLSASNINHCVLRIAGVFGFNGPTHLGLNRAIEGVFKGEAPVQNGSGAGLRNYIYVKDVSQAIVYALNEGLSGTHLLSGSEVISINDMLQLVCNTLSPRLHPILKDEVQVNNQVVEPSTLLPKTRGFKDALIDIQKEWCQ